MYAQRELSGDRSSGVPKSRIRLSRLSLPTSIDASVSSSMITSCRGAAGTGMITHDVLAAKSMQRHNPKTALLAPTFVDIRPTIRNRQLLTTLPWVRFYATPPKFGVNSEMCLMSASRPEVLSQATSAILSKDDPRSCSALRYRVSSYGVRVFQHR